MVAQRDPLQFTLEVLQDRATDYDWLSRVYERLCRQLQTELRHPGRISEALAKLELVIHYVISREDLERWSSPLHDALLIVMDTRDEELQVKVWSQLGAIYLRSGKYRSARTTLDRALNLPETELTQDLRLLARIGWLSLRGIFYTEDIDRFITETLAAARHTQREDLLAWLHYCVGQVYVNLGHTVEALGYLQSAYVRWLRLGNAAQCRNVLLAMAESCRVAERFGMARQYLSLAGEDEGDRYGDGIHCYHQGSLLFHQGRYEAAAVAYERALDQFQQLNYPYLLASARHALGLVYTYLGKFKAAETHLQAALKTWIADNHLYQHVALIHVLGFLAQRQDDVATARTQYQEALRLLARLPDVPSMVTLRQDIEGDLASLPASS